MRQSLLASVLAILATATGAHAAPTAQADLKQQVAATERAFAATMRERDFEKFQTYIAEDAIFFTEAGPVHGRAAVLAEWKKYFATPTAPFSWEPEEVEVVGAGNLAISTGPVKNAKGELSLRFSSIWRLDPDGMWRNLIDHGWPK